MNRRNTPRISFIGFGEAGQAIASGLKDAGVERIAAWDILFPEQAGAPLKAAGEAIGVRTAASAADAVRETDIVISAVTAASSVDAARSVAPHLNGNPYYLDINSVSPGRKQETARLLGERARYVDVAVVAAIHPARHRTPLLIAGPHAEEISPLLRELEMQLSVVGPETGSAAAIKMIRSVMIKGIEALTLECFLAAARAGVLDEVTASLKNNYPTLDWGQIADYNLERMASHGARRAAEMEESAATLRELGLDPLMVDSTVKRQREMGAIGKLETVRAALEIRTRRHPWRDKRSGQKQALTRRPHECTFRFGGGRFSVNFLSSWRATFYYVSSKNWWGGINEIQKSCICHVRCGGRRRFCDRLGRAQRGREKEEGGSRGTAAAPAGRLRRRTGSGVRDQGRQEVHLSQRLLGRERRREGRQAG